MPDPPPRVYARQLLPLGCGYPLWTPEPGNQFLRYRRDGLRIGDVGVVVPENGSFDVFFNICLPREHPFHRASGVPDNFVHIDLDELDVAIYPHAENSGSVIPASSVTTLRIVEPSDGAVSHQNALTYEFSLSSNEGALLILPDGAESYTLLKRKIFKDVATRNGLDWYKFAEEQLGRIITHDSLYLITGCYKSHSWSVAAFHEVSSQTGATEFPAQFKPGQVRQGNVSTAYTWETTRALHWRVGPLGDWNFEFPNQAVFISGFKIAIRDNILGRKRVEVEVDAPPTRLKPTKLYSNSTGHSRALRIWRRLVSKSGGGEKDSGDQIEAGSSNNPGVAAGNSMDPDGRVTVTHIPETLQSFHPSDIINRCLLGREPSAVVAVTHDSQWNILLEKGVLKPEDLSRDGQLENIMLENYHLVSQDGMVCLKTISDCSIRLADMDDAVRDAWKEDRLDDAEELLSRQIIRRLGSDHSVFASRALIRARLHLWDAALRDAETSIDIQPSVTAHVAKGFALFGQQKYARAVHVFNVALRECDVRDKVLVSLIKCVVLFEVMYHAESMAEIADLTKHCPVDSKAKCSATQAGMYLRLATLAIENKDYDRVLQLLSRAQSLGPFHVAPELDIISLICGWRFDNLQFSIHRQNCETFFLAGRINEAVESLREVTRDLGEDVRMRKDNVEWITRFTQQCTKALENLGDGALASQNYTDAIRHYSETLSVGPVAREGILVKRSNAHAGAGAWNDALHDADEAITLDPLSPWGHERRLAALQGMGRQDEAIQAFNSMLSALESIAYPHTQQHRSEPTGQTMAIQRIDPRVQTLRHHPPLRNLDHKLIIESIMTARNDVGSRRATDILDLLRTERDEMIRERDVFPSVDRPERQLGAVNEAPGANFATPDEPSQEQMSASERYQKLHDQLTDLVRKNQEDDKQAPELMKMMLRLAEQQLILRPQQDEQNNVPVLELLDDLRSYNAKQRELLDALSGYWNKDAPGSKGKQQEGADREQQLPYGFRGLREDFLNALATEAQMIVHEVARLGEERRQLQQELGQLMMMKSKYGPGGEYDPEWQPPPRPRLPPHVPGKVSRIQSQREPTRPAASPPKPRSTGLGNVQQSRPAWRSVQPVVKQGPPAVKPLRIETGTVGLLGPYTPPGTSLLDVEPASSPTDVAPKTSMTARPVSPSETLALQPGHDEPALTQRSPPSKDRSSPRFDESSAPSPLELTFHPLEDLKFKASKKFADSSHVTDKFGGAIDI